jgi:hypothetical protein
MARSRSGAIELAEGVCGQDLREFFDRWLYREEVPPIQEMLLGG